MSAAQKVTVRQLVEENWERAAFLDFYGWDVCPQPQTGSNQVIVRVNASLSGPGAADLGKKPNFSNVIQFRDTSPSAHTILNLFGRTLGFADETVSGGCSQRMANSDAAMAVAVDAGTALPTSLESEGDATLSVMAGLSGAGGMPCNQASSLSAWDTIGVRTAYGRKPSGTLAGLGGLSLNIAGGNSAPGTLIVGQPSGGAVNDVWRRNGLLLQANLGTQGSPVDRCLNIQGGSVSGGFTPLISWWCDSAASNEQFHLQGVQWRAMGTMCIAAESAAASAYLSLASCSAASSLQKWDFFEGDGTIRLNGTNLCATVADQNSGAGARLKLSVCATPPGTTQTFQFMGTGSSAGELRFSNLCVDVVGGLTTVGSQLGLRSCGATVVSDRFTIRGPVTALGQCVNMFGGVPMDGVGIGMFPCQSGAPNEIWEYFW